MGLFTLSEFVPGRDLAPQHVHVLITILKSSVPIQIYITKFSALLYLHYEVYDMSKNSVPYHIH